MNADAVLAERVRSALDSRWRVEEKGMFGGLAFLHAGHMACGVIGSELMVRVGPEAIAAALERAGTRPMAFHGRTVKGVVRVAKEGMGTRNTLHGWLEQAIAFTETLPQR